MISLFGEGPVPAVREPRADVTWTPLDSRWYGSLSSGGSDAGVYVTPESILEIPVVLAAARFLSQNSVAMCTPQAFRKTKDGREEAPDHYMQAVMRQPYTGWTGHRWRMQQMMWLAIHGNAYNLIISDGRAPVTGLKPIHPSLVRVIDRRADDRLVYEVSSSTGPAKVYTQEHILHFRGVSADGVTGLPMYKLMAQAAGIAVASEKHAAVFLRKGARMSGILTAPGVLQDPVRKRMEDSFKSAYSGSDNVGKTALLEAGVTYTPMSLDHEKAQFLESRDFQVGELLRFMGVPGVVVGYAEKTATYASAKEFFESGGIKHCILPWLMNLEAEINDACIPEGDPHFIRFNLDVLMRASLRDRYDAHSKAVGRPWMTANEVRKLEDLPPDTDPESDMIADKASPAAAPGGDPLVRPHDTPQEGLP